MYIEWTDADPVTGAKRYIKAEKFARKWQFRVRFRQRYDNWEEPEAVTRDMWETLLDALERRYPRREGVTDEDLRQVRAIIAGLPEEEKGSPQRHEDHTEGHEEDK